MAPIALETLANGLTAVAIERPAAHQVLVVLMVRTGSRFEDPAQAGISHFLEHMLFRGNGMHATSRELSLAFEQTGGMLNATTGVESTEFYFICHPERLDQGLEQLAGFVQGPTFPDLEKERQIIQDEILYDYNDHGDLVDLPTLAAQLLWPGHPLSQPITGTPPTLAALSLDALRRYHLQAYAPGSVVLALAGKLQPEQALGVVQRHFGAWPMRPPGSNGKPMP
ncbi:MAG TPA: pitrilysin family protein, partial [bacterium]|nr:pitrilysin family protein [bacterium]